MGSEMCIRDSYDTFIVAGEQLAVDAGTGVEAFGVGQGRELDEVAVAGGILGKQDKMVVRLASGFSLPGAATAGSNVGLHAYDGLDPRRAGFFLEFPGSVHVSMICNGKRRLFEFLGSPDQVIDAICAIQQGVFRMAMEMNEGHLRTICEAPWLR